MGKLHCIYLLFLLRFFSRTFADSVCLRNDVGKTLANKDYQVGVTSITFERGETLLCLLTRGTEGRM